MPETRPLQILRSLSAAGVDFIVVGGVAAVLNGAPVNTFDLDIVHARNAANIARLVEVLDRLDAIYRMQASRRLKPNASHLSSAGHHNLLTAFGPLDVLGTIGRDLDYAALLPHTKVLEIGDELRAKVLDLEKLIELKQELAGEKDLAVLPILKRTLRTKRESGG
jgi:hypothetical protein